MEARQQQKTESQIREERRAWARLDAEHDVLEAADEEVTR